MSPTLLRFRQLGFPLLIAFAIGLLSVIAQVGWLYVRAEEEAAIYTQNVATIMLPASSEAVYELNNEMGHRIVESLTTKGMMHSAMLVDEQRQVFSSSQAQEENGPEWFFPGLKPLSVNLYVKGSSKIYGQLVLEPSRYQWQQQFWRSALQLAGLEFIRSFILALVLTLLLRRMIEKPFQQLAEKLQDIDPADPNETLRLLQKSQISEQLGLLGRNIEEFLLGAQKQVIERNRALGRLEELERLQSTLAESEERYRRLISALAEGVILQNRRRQIVTYNEAALIILGLTPRELLRRQTLDHRAVYEDGTPYPIEEHPALVTLRTGEPQQGVIMGIHQSNGELRWISINTQALYDKSSQQPESVVTSFTDITNKRQIELALQQSQQEAERYLQTAAVVMMAISGDGKIKLANQRAADILGMPAQDMIGLDFTEQFIPPQHRDQAREYFRRAFAAEEQFAGDIIGSILTCKGEQRILAWHNVRVRNERGEIESLMGSGEDITEAQRLQSSLQLRTTLLEQLSTDQDLDHFIDELFYTLRNQLPDFDALLLMPHEDPAVLGYQYKEQRQFWEQWLDTVRNEPSLWPENSRRLSDMAQHAGMAALLAEHVWHPPEGVSIASLPKCSEKVAFVLYYNPDLEPNEQQLAALEVFKHVATLAIERHLRNQLLKSTTAKALSASQAKSEFLANMSHEIRTPLNAVLGFAELLQQTPLSIDQKEFAESIRSAGDALLSLINDLLDYSKIEAGRLELELIDFDVRRCLDDVFDIVAEKAADKGLALYALVDPQIPYVLQGDPGRFKQILLNLLNNSVKFTHAGRISIRLSLLDQQSGMLNIRCEVADTGIGIDPAQTSRLFQPFTQADASTTRQFGGTGLGLSICRRLVEAMQGNIGVTSQPGLGSTFWFTAHLRAGSEQPAAPVTHADHALAFVDQPFAASVLRSNLGDQLTLPDIHDPQQWPSGQPAWLLVDIMDQAVQTTVLAHCREKYPDSPQILLAPLKDLHLKNTGQNGPITLPRPLRRKLLLSAIARCLNNEQPAPASSARPQAAKQPDMHVLLVEDNPLNQRVASLMLKQLGCVVDIASHGGEAISAVKAKPYELVFMDCQMPVMDGYSATRQIRKLEPALADLPIIALTSNAFHEDREACFAAGMNDFITKPVTLDSLNQALQRWVH